MTSNQHRSETTVHRNERLAPITQHELDPSALTQCAIDTTTLTDALAAFSERISDSMEARVLRICPVAARLPRPRERLESQSPPLLLHSQGLVLRELRDNRLMALKHQLPPARAHVDAIGRVSQMLPDRLQHIA